MANASINVPFYVSKAGRPFSGGVSGMRFSSLVTIGGEDKLAEAPFVSEIGAGWYKFSVAYGSSPFDEGDLVGVINADANGTGELSEEEKYIPVEVRLDFYALSRLVNRMSQDKVTGDMVIRDIDGAGILKLRMVESESQVERLPEMG